MTLTIEVTEVGRTTVAMQWSREPGAAGVPSSYQVFRCVAPAAFERIAGVIAGRKFIDPNCAPRTTYQYRVAAIGLPVAEDDIITVTTRPPTEFPSSVEFFHEYLAKIMARDPFGEAQRWCLQWPDHPEAAEVVNALWRAYEAHRPPDDPAVPSTERAVWLTVYAYPLMERLWALDGGLANCSRHPDRATHEGFPPLPD